MKISAYIPCYNNRDTIARAIESIRAQTVPVDEFFIVDNGSTDGSSKIASDMGVRIIAIAENQGRGVARAFAMKQAAHELVLCCDGAKALNREFVAIAAAWFENPQVAAVFGCLRQPPAATAVERWRARHLFKLPVSEPQHHALLATGGAIIRASAATKAGGYDAGLTMVEDADLGNRLLAAGFDVICDPGLAVIDTAENSIAQVLERYWRWYTAPHGRMSTRDYLKQMVFSIRTMAGEDLAAGDPGAALISLASPHYQFWKSRQK